jgi:hypothetical protein
MPALRRNGVMDVLGFFLGFGILVFQGFVVDSGSQPSYGMLALAAFFLTVWFLPILKRLAR